MVFICLLPPGAACHILECSDSLAQDVISTIGQAFDLRFQQYLQCPSSKPSSTHDRSAHIRPESPQKINGIEFF